MSAITYGSLFSGAGGADLGLDRAGMTCLWQCERDKNCAKLLRARWPDALFSDDVQTFDPDKFPCPNVIWFSSPCQDVSVAGRRAGMAGERSGLFYDATRIIQRYAGLGLEFAVWEQVPGVFSSHGGRDFAGVLREMAKCGALDVAWRVLDAQWLGVAQRRKRVFLVADFRGERAAEVLSLAQSLRGDTPPSREARQDLAPTISARTKGGGGLGTDFDCGGGLIPSVVGALNDGAHNGGGSTDRMRTAVESLPAVAWALQERDAKGSDSSTKEGHLILLRRGGFFDEAPIAFSSKDHGADATADLSPTLRACPHDESHANGSGPPAIAIPLQEVGKRTGKSTTDLRFGLGIGADNAPMFTLQAGAQHGVAFKPSHYTRGKDGAPSAISPPLSADADKGDQEPLIFQTRIARNGRGQPDSVCPALNGTNAGDTSDMRPVVVTPIAVRRLTPTECLRLMSWPDDHFDGLGFADSTKYKMCGNGVVANVSEWIARRVVAALRP